MEETLHIQKANPQAGDVYVRPLLTSVSYTYATKDMATQSFMAAVRANTRVGVQLQTSHYTKYNKGDILRAILEPRAPGSKFAQIGFDVDNSNYYSCTVYGGESEISDEVRANYQLQDSLEASRTRLLTRAAISRREQKGADILFATSGSWDKVVNGTSGSGTFGTSFKQWNLSGSTPIADIKSAKTYIGDQTGIDANTLILPQGVWDVLTENGDVVSRLLYADKGIVTQEVFAQLCGVKRVVVGKFRRNTANKGAANSIANVIGDKALLCYLPDSPGAEEMSAFQTFEWEGLMGAAGGMRTLMVRDNRTRTDVLQIEDAFDTKITCSDLGWLFNDCTG